MKVIKSMLDLIGNTPIKRLDAIGKGFDFCVWAKLEQLNPSGSLKDRIALQMIQDAEERGDLREGIYDHRIEQWQYGDCLKFCRGRKRIQNNHIYAGDHGQRKGGDD